MVTPEPLSGPAVWRGAEMAGNQRWQFSLSGADLGEIDRALAAARTAGRAMNSLDAESFPLDALGVKLRDIGRELEDGCGFARLRGLPLDAWNRADLQTIYCGMASYLGSPVFQDAHGQLFREIRAEAGDVGRRYGQLDAGPARFLSSRARTASSAELRFHTDRCDIVALLCIGRAERGGLSRLASSMAVHNEMLNRSPALCAELYRGLPRSRMGEEAGGHASWYRLPVWGARDGKFTSHYSRTFVEALAHIKCAPVVSRRQWQALDLLAELAAELSLTMMLEPGDLQFVNNHVIYHARTAFWDDPGSDRIRCLWRLWLCAPHRSLPASHRVLWGEVKAGRRRGGIAQAGKPAV